MSKVKYYYDSSTLSYRKIQNERWKITKLFTAFLATVSIGLAINSFVSDALNKNEKDSFEIDNRIENLEKISSDLESLSLFIENQKVSLKEQNRALTELKNENLKLEKVVGINKENVEALFQIQEDNAKKRIWSDRIIGFFFGLAGSFLIALMFRIWDKGKKKDTPNNDDEIYVRKPKD